MKIIKTKIKNLLLLKTNIFKDKRGFFKEVQKNNILKKKFVFDCFSFSKKKHSSWPAPANKKKSSKNHYCCSRKNFRCCC